MYDDFDEPDFECDHPQVSVMQEQEIEIDGVKYLKISTYCNDCEQLIIFLEELSNAKARKSKQSFSKEGS